MPLYEYQCEVCGHRFEKIQKFSDPPIDSCPSCGGSVRKLISSPAFQFKGSGWYVTDYARSGGAADAESKPDTGKKADEGVSGGKTADKPAPAETKKADKPTGTD